MLILSIGNSYSQIQGLSSHQHRELRKRFSYIPGGDNAHFSGFRAFPKSLIDKKGFFPTGLLESILGFCNGHGWEMRVTDSRKKPAARKTLSFKAPELYPDQLAAIKKATACGRGGIVMPTGTGKSLAMAGIVAHYGLKTLIVVPTVELKRQLTESFQGYFGDLSQIDIENIDSTGLRHKPKKPYDLLIIDECHHAAAKTYQKLNQTVWNEIYHRFFFTATYFRNQSNEHLLFEGICGPAIYRLTYKDAISKQYIVPVEAYHYEVPKQKTDATTWAEVYSELVVNNDARNSLINQLLCTLNGQGIPTLCLVKEIAHGRLLSDLSTIPFVSGEDAESRKYIADFNAGRIKALIGTTGVMGEGLDSKPAQYVIIAGLGKAKSAFLQQVGRGVRTYPNKESCKVVLFLDKSHKFTLRHYREQVKILKEELGINCLKLEDI